jgi:hypothetical protein
MLTSIGVTGTRKGANEAQLGRVFAFLSMFRHTPNMVLHHGDCVGVDEQVAGLARSIGYRIVGHPPDKNEFRAYFPSDEVRQPFPYLIRNRHIIDECQTLIAVPRETVEQLRSGTWATIRFARSVEKPIKMVMP